MAKRLLRLPEVMSKTGLKQSQIYDMKAKGKFPESVPLGRNAIAWVEEEIDRWIDERIAARKPQEEQAALPAVA